MADKKGAGAAAFWRRAAALLRRRWVLPLGCCLLAWAGALLGAAGHLAVDAHRRAAGTLRTQTLTLADFTLVNAHIDPAASDTLVSDNEDPQMIYTAAAGCRLQSLQMHIDYDRYPYERCLYYTTAPDEAFGEEKRVWPLTQPDGSQLYMLPRAACAIRLDPGSCTDLHAAFGDILLNGRRPAWRYFVPDGGQVFWLIAAPLLAAAVLQWLLDTFPARGRRTTKAPKMTAKERENP